MKTMKISLNALTITIQTDDDIQCTVKPDPSTCTSTLYIEKINSGN